MTVHENMYREAQIKAKADLTNEGFKGLILINGAGAIALGTLLQALIGKPEVAGLLPWVLAGIAFCAIGVACAGSSFWIRYDQWQLEVDKGQYRSENPKWRLAWRMARISLAMFVLGLFLAVIGGFVTFTLKPTLSCIAT